MNERIKLLAAEAWQYANNNSRDGDETHGWLYRDKFAELIMDECFGVLRKRFMGDWNREDQEVLRCIEDIRKHFGVEE